MSFYCKNLRLEKQDLFAKKETWNIKKTAMLEAWRFFL